MRGMKNGYKRGQRWKVGQNPPGRWGGIVKEAEGGQKVVDKTVHQNHRGTRGDKKVLGTS